MYESRNVRMLLGLCLMTGLWAGVAGAADHLDAPSLAEQPNLDVNDLYAFQSPNSADNTVLIMTVNPFADADASFSTAAKYQFLVDNTGDAEPDVQFSASFFPGADGRQTVLVTGTDASILAQGSTESDIAVSGGGWLRAGLFDDPFFFDLAGFQDGLNFTGTDSLAGANVSGIVLEVPSAMLGGPDVGIWARTVVEGHQVDRVGRPAINTVLIPGDRKDAFNEGEPDHDPADFAADVRASILALSGDAEHADTLTGVLLPDVLTIDVTSAAGFLNGRQLTDDVIDIELDLLTLGAVQGDGVHANDVPFRSDFPYLAEPHVVPEPSGQLLALFALPLLGRWRRSRFGR